LFNYSKQVHEAFLPSQPLSATESDASAQKPTSAAHTTGAVAHPVGGRPAELARPGSTKGRSDKSVDGAIINDRSSNQRFGHAKRRRIALLLCGANEIGRSSTLEDVKRHVASLSAEFQCDALIELATSIKTVPRHMRVDVLDYLYSQISSFRPDRQAAYMREIALSIESLPTENDAREAAWGGLTSALKMMPGQMVLQPIVALIDAITHFQDQAVRSDRLGLLVPLTIAGEPQARNIMTDRLIQALAHVAPGDHCIHTIEQIALLVRELDFFSTAHLHLLIEQTRHCTPQNNLLGLLETVIQLARRLPTEEQCRVLMAIPQQFGYWQDSAKIRVSMLMIGREAQLAPQGMQDQLAQSMGEGLSAVLSNLVKKLENDITPEQTSAEVGNWLHSAALSTGSIRKNIYLSASSLVELAWHKDHPFKEAMLESYGDALSLASRQQLEGKLGIGK